MNCIRIAVAVALIMIMSDQRLVESSWYAVLIIEEINKNKNEVKKIVLKPTGEWQVDQIGRWKDTMTYKMSLGAKCVIDSLADKIPTVEEIERTVDILKNCKVFLRMSSREMDV